MSVGLVQENIGSNDMPENIGKFNINSLPEKSIHERMIEASKQLQVIHKGNWCRYNQDKFCQESLCSDCAVSQKDQ